MDITPQALSAVYTAVSTAFNTGMGTYSATGDRIATTVPSTKSENKYAWLGDMTEIVEWVGDRQIKKLKIHDYAIKNKKFENTRGIKAEFIEDDEYGLTMPVFQNMGYAAASHPDKLIYSLLAAGFTTPCYDGQMFFDTDHPVGKEGQEQSVSNMQAGAGNPWFLLSTQRPLKPIIKQVRKPYRILAKTDAGTSDHVFMADEYLYGCDARLNVGFGLWQLAFASKAVLDQDNFNAGFAAMGSLESDEGMPLGIMPDLLVCGISNRAAANQVVKVMNLANGGSNPNYQAVEVLVVPWLK